MDVAEPYKVYQLLPPGTVSGEFPLVQPLLDSADWGGRIDVQASPRLLIALPCPCPWGAATQVSLPRPAHPSLPQTSPSPSVLAQDPDLSLSLNNSTGQPGTQKSPSKRHHSSVSSEREEEEDAMQNCTLSPSVLQDSLNNVRDGEGTGWA